MTFTWRCLLPHTPSPTFARSSHAITIIDNHTLYLFGGENQPRVPVDNVLYTLSLKDASPSWQAVALSSATVPPPRIAPGLATSDGVIYCFGGRQGIHMDESPLDDLWSFHIEKKEWVCVSESVQKEGGPQKRSFHQMVACKGKLYVFGGCGADGRMHDLYAYDIKSNKWELLPEVKEMRGRGGAAVTAVDGKIIVLCGFAGEETKDMYAYDIEKKEWEDWSEYSANLIPRSVLGLAPVEGGKSLVIFGGEVAESSEGHMGAGGFAGDTLLFSLTDKKKGFTSPLATDTPTSPSPRGWYAYGATGEGVFVCVGGLAPDNSRLGDVWVLEETKGGAKEEL